MPRVTIKKKEYKMRDLKGWIVHQMKINGLRQSDIAEALGTTQPHVSEMLRVPVKGNKGKEREKIDPFTYGDLLTLFELFGTSDEEKQRLFTL